MEIQTASRLPKEWATKKPIERYETQYLYVGLSRYNTVKKTLSSIFRTAEGKTIYTETPYEGSLARCYVTEYVTISVYSHSPRVWKEDMGTNDQTVFVQQPTHVA
jgi:hypothetical protein